MAKKSKKKREKSKKQASKEGKKNRIKDSRKKPEKIEKVEKEEKKEILGNNKKEKNNKTALKKEKKKNKTSKEKAKESKPRKKVKKAQPFVISKTYAIMIAAVIVLVVVNVALFVHRRNVQIKNSSSANQKTQQDALKNEESSNRGHLTKEEEQAEQNTENWKTYTDQIFGFELKYPQDWIMPQIEPKKIGSKYQYKITFSSSTEESDRVKGFEIFVYKPIKRTSFLDPNYTNNLTIKDGISPRDLSGCKEFNDYSLGQGNYSTKEIYVLPDDKCFKEAYFFRVAHLNYIYDIVPIPPGGYGFDGYNGEKETKSNFSEFYEILKTFKFNEIKVVVPSVTPKTSMAPSPTVQKPEIKRPPTRGLLTCPEKHDHPQKSDTKGKHMDEDCCPDPDEWPNPACYYSAKGRGILIGRPKK